MFRMNNGLLPLAVTCVQLSASFIFYCMTINVKLSSVYFDPCDEKFPDQQVSIIQYLPYN